MSEIYHYFAKHEIYLQRSQNVFTHFMLQPKIKKNNGNVFHYHSTFNAPELQISNRILNFFLNIFIKKIKLKWYDAKSKFSGPFTQYSVFFPNMMLRIKAEIFNLSFIREPCFARTV